MSHALQESVSDSIRRELRLFAKDTFEKELMRLGDRVEKGLREELREFLECWGSSEGGKAASPEPIVGTLSGFNDGQSGWFKKHRGVFGLGGMLKQVVSSSRRGSLKDDPQEKKGGAVTEIVPSDNGIQALPLMAPPILNTSPAAMRRDSLMYRHPKGFRVGQETEKTKSTGGHFRMTCADNNSSAVGDRVLPLPDGEAEALPVHKALPDAEFVKANSESTTARLQSPKEDLLTVDELDSDSPVSPFSPQSAPQIERMTSPSEMSVGHQSNRSRASVRRENGSIGPLQLADCQSQSDAGSLPDIPDDDHVYGIAGRTSLPRPSSRHSLFNEIDSATAIARFAGAKSKRALISEMVKSPNFDYLTGALIVVNSMVIGIQTDHMARNLTNEVPLTFAVIERIFCAAFTIELSLRFITHGKKFFYGSGWRWNLFDTVIVVLQLTEEIMNMIASITQTESQSQQIENLSIMRTLRILRLIRIIRLVRVLRLISELRTIVVSIVGSMKSLGWTILLLLLMMYIIGVFLTQLVSSYKVEHAGAILTQGHENLGEFYGDLGRSILTLFQSISGGLDWDDSVSPLMDYISPWLALMFCLYIAFAVFALFNIVTGVFVESALATAKGDQDLLLMHNVRQLFTKADVDNNGNITWSEFQSSLENEQMVMYFQAIDLDKEEARELFKLIDIDDSGSIDPEEFLNGCFRLRGPAKSIDLAVLMHETRRMNKKWYLHAKFVESSLSLMLQQVGIPVQQLGPGQAQSRESNASASSLISLSGMNGFGGKFTE